MTTMTSPLYCRHFPLSFAQRNKEILTMPISINPGQVVHCHSEDEYFEILRLAGDALVVVDCFADWCAPCVYMSPIFEALAREKTNVIFVKVDVDQVPSIKSIIGVYAMPTFAFVKHGNKVGSFIGAKEATLRYGVEHDGNVGICSSCVMM
jgi:thioredoxin 1